MKILQIISHYVPAYRFGGPLLVAHSLGKALVHLGHEVTVVTTSMADSRNDLDTELDRPVNIDGISVYYEKVLGLRYWGFSPGLWKRASREISNSDLVLVHSYYQFANWAGSFLSSRSGRDYVIFAHGTLHQHAVGHRNQAFKQIYLRLMEERHLKKAKFIAFNAPEELEQSYYNQYGRVIPSGIDPANFAAMPEPGRFRKQHPELIGKSLLLFLGRLDVDQKGLDMLLDAFQTMHRDNPDTYLILAGPDEENGKKRLEDQAGRLGISSKVLFTGLVSGAEKLAILQDADMFVMSSRFEGLSIALLEALYIGLPVLVTNRVGLWREIEQVEAGIVVDAEVNAIAQGLKNLLVQKDRFRRNGIEMVKHKYTWDAIALKLFDEVNR